MEIIKDHDTKIGWAFYLVPEEVYCECKQMWTMEQQQNRAGH